MTTTPLPQWIDDLAASRQPMYTLPQPFYTDDRIFQEDLHRVYFKNWVLAGHIARLPTPGSYFLYQIAKESIIITLGRDGQVHALFNVCRHRGSQLCREEQGQNKRSLLCPYHAWNFALDGTLLKAPAMSPQFSKSDYGLRKLHVEIFQGFIYICFAETPPPIEPIFQEIEPYVRMLDLSKAKLGRRMTWTIRANWKLVTENFAECYHCGPAHPEYCSVMSHALPGTTGLAKHKEAYEEEERKWIEMTRTIGHLAGSISYKERLQHTVARIPIGKNGMSQGRDGKQVVRMLLGNYKVNDGGITAFRIHPAGYLIAPNDYAMITRFTPLTTQTTLQEILWLVHPDAQAGKDYDPEELIWLWRVTTDQDQIIIEDNQRGINSMGYSPGPYSETEGSVDRFLQWYLQELTGRTTPMPEEHATGRAAR